MRRSILVLLAICVCIRTGSGESETTPVRSLSAIEVRSLFGFTYSDLMDQIVIIASSSGSLHGGGSGFIAQQEGKTYIFTNQHVLLGMDNVSFRTAGGKTLHPTGVELSYARDIARLPIGEQVECFLLSGDAEEQAPAVVMGNSEGAGVAREVFGRILEVDEHRIEISAEFVAGNSGSPLVLTNGLVVGIAAYVTHYDNDEEGDRTQRFCYRILCDDWRPVNWRSYNGKHGRKSLEYEALAGSIELLFEAWQARPYEKMAAGNLEDDRLRNWANRHNEMIEEMLQFSKYGERKYAGYKQVEQANDKIKEEMRTRWRVLAMLCTTTVKDLRRLADPKSVTEYQQKKYLYLAVRLELLADAIEETGRYLAQQDVFTIR